MKGNMTTVLIVSIIVLIFGITVMVYGIMKDEYHPHPLIFVGLFTIILDGIFGFLQGGLQSIEHFSVEVPIERVYRDRDSITAVVECNGGYRNVTSWSVEVYKAKDADLIITKHWDRNSYCIPDYRTYSLDAKVNHVKLEKE